MILHCPVRAFYLLLALLVLFCQTASAAITMMSETFGTNTTSSYAASNGYSLSYITSSSTDFGDGLNDGALQVSVTASNNTGLLRHTLGTIDSNDVGNQLTLTFRLDGASSNFHSDNLAFTLFDGLTTAAISATTASTTTFTEWDSTGTAAVIPAATLSDWRARNGVGTLTYTITAGDVGKSLGWQFASASTSSGGYTFRVDNWDLAVASVPEPSKALLTIAGLMICGLHRRRPR